MECIVTNCEDCPMFYDGRKSNDYDSLVCNHPESEYKPANPIEIDCSGDEMSYIEWVVTPDWCPLEKESITIKLKQD